MNKSKLYIIIIIGLLLSNILLVGFFMLKKPPHPMHQKPRELVISKLNLNTEQVKQYDELIKQHQTSIREKEENILELKNTLYLSLSIDNSSSQKDSIINELGKIQIEIEIIHYKHFADIKSICKPEQLTNYNLLLKDIASLFSKPMMEKPKK